MFEVSDTVTYNKPSVLSGNHRNCSERRGMGSAFQQCAQDIKGLPTAPTAIRLWETFTFFYHRNQVRFNAQMALHTFRMVLYTFKETKIL